MSHLIDLGYRNSDRHYHPTCTCGRTFQATRWASAALADTNVHLAAVGQQTIPRPRETWARRYMGARRPTFTPPSGGSAA
jgi:hypothetical protein